MALKDLVARRSALTEKQIEEIVAECIGYDLEEKVVFHRPEFTKLTNRAKVLVHLVALQGWSFVTEEIVPSDASPADLEKALHIPGGTLRPILKELKDQHLISVSGKRYSVRESGLEPIKSELTVRVRGGARVAPEKRTRKARKAAAAPTKSGASTEARRLTSNKSGQSARIVRLQSWIDDGFFDAPRTLNDVHQRFHEEADIVQRTSLPSYLLAAVTQKRLNRRKEEVGGREVWVYQATPKGRS